MQFVFGENTVLKLGEWRVESLADENGKKFPGYVADMTTWMGLQVVNRHSAVRIKNLGTNIGKGMTDDLAFEALATARRESDNASNGYTLAEPWKATSPLVRAKGPARCQPRATPWVCTTKRLSPEGAAQVSGGFVSPLQGCCSCGSLTQGVALGWHGSGRWPARTAFGFTGPCFPRVGSPPASGRRGHTRARPTPAPTRSRPRRRPAASPRGCG